jgi:hypothetical protein
MFYYDLEGDALGPNNKQLITHMDLNNYIKMILFYIKFKKVIKKKYFCFYLLLKIYFR